MLSVEIKMDFDPNNLNKQLQELPFDITEQIGNEVRKSAKLRARRWSGYLKDSIEVEARM